MNMIIEINKIIAEYDLLKHMFYISWSKGELSLAVLQKYAAQYYHQVKTFPRFISKTHAGCEEIAARKVLLSNLIDEELHGTDHPALWMQFAKGLGLTEKEVLAEPPLVETNKMVQDYYKLADRDWRDGLCALYAYEYQVPSVAASKIKGLVEFYDITDPKTLAFFTAHQEYDVEHAEQVASLITKYADIEQAKTATHEACLALWQFLDGMCNEAGIRC